MQKLKFDTGILRLFCRNWKENYAFDMRNTTAGLFIKSFCFDMLKYLHVNFTTDLSKKLLAYSKLSPKHLKWSFRNVYLGRDQKAEIQTILFNKTTIKDNEKEITSGWMRVVTAEKWTVFWTVIVTSVQCCLHLHLCCSLFWPMKMWCNPPALSS